MKTEIICLVKSLVFAMLLILTLNNNVSADSLDFFLRGFYPKGRYVVFYNRKKLYEFENLSSCVLSKKLSVILPDTIKDESYLNIAIYSYAKTVNIHNELLIRYSSHYKYILITGYRNSKNADHFLYYVWTNGKPDEDDYCSCY